MKQIYKVTLIQGFNAHQRKYSWIDLFINRKRYENKIYYHTVTGREKYIYMLRQRNKQNYYMKRDILFQK